MNETAPDSADAVLDTSHLRAELARLRRRRRIILAGGLLVLLLAAGLWFVGKRGGEPVSVRYLTDAAQRGDLSITVTATGNLSPTNQVDVGAEISELLGCPRTQHDCRAIENSNTGQRTCHFTNPPTLPTAYHNLVTGYGHI